MIIEIATSSSENGCQSVQFDINIRISTQIRIQTYLLTLGLNPT